MRNFELILISPKALTSDDLQGSLAERCVPLIAGNAIAGFESSRSFKQR